MIGVYRDQTKAEAAIARLKLQSGFSLAPSVVDPNGADIEGFYISEYVLDEDHWTEGFAKV